MIPDVVLFDQLHNQSRPLLGHQLRPVPRGHDVRPDPAFDERLPLGWCLFQEVLPGSRVSRHHDSENVQPALLATDSFEQRDDLILRGVVNSHGDARPTVRSDHLCGFFNCFGPPALTWLDRFGCTRLLRPVQYTVAPASPNMRAIPRPAPRVAPAATATRPSSGLDMVPSSSGQLVVDLRGRLLRGQRGQLIRLSAPQFPNTTHLTPADARRNDACMDAPGCISATNGQPTPRTWAEKDRKVLWMKAVWRSHAGGGLPRALAANPIEAATPLHARRSVGRIPNRKSPSVDHPPEDTLESQRSSCFCRRCCYRL